MITTANETIAAKHHAIETAKAYKVKLMGQMYRAEEAAFNATGDAKVEWTARVRDLSAKVARQDVKIDQMS